MWPRSRERGIVVTIERGVHPSKASMWPRSRERGIRNEVNPNARRALPASMWPRSRERGIGGGGVRYRCCGEGFNVAALT